ncbi:hypothetical protein EXIGLDRAFT_764867 [Exidia glandulosa HHB12029]|uniref:Uncharacterized protein n=1 Tax=Exidia glandulosa HHB12029 TaxID=1314781 RepID=A0A165KVQ8_EXIGL|nr:hypothetical protein EXIGLDRAFT_764867 [Exidia glandulosa HHB12029]
MAALLADLRTVKLRQTHIERDSSAPRLVGELDAISDSYDASVLQCNIENWLPLLGPPGLTFETLLVPLTVEQAQLLIRAYDEAERHPPTPEAVVSDPPLNSEEASLRASLLPPIQAALDQLAAADGKGCIVKTSSRSPKDAAARTGALERILREALSHPSNDRALSLDEEMLRVVCEAEGAALRFSRAEDILRALVLSERIWQDMTLALRHPDSFKQNIVVRRWESVDVTLEFRCFVHAGRLTAISQYAYQLYSPSLVESIEAARNTIVAYFDSQLREILVQGGFETCIVDVALLPQSDTAEHGQWWPRVIELNPFLPSTDAALFSWERERSLLEGSEALSGRQSYPVIRVCERARTGGLAVIPKAWKDVVSRVRLDLQ